MGPINVVMKIPANFNFRAWLRVAAMRAALGRPTMAEKIVIRKLCKTCILEVTNGETGEIHNYPKVVQKLFRQHKSHPKFTGSADVLPHTLAVLARPWPKSYRC